MLRPSFRLLHNNSDARGGVQIFWRRCQRICQLRNALLHIEVLMNARVAGIRSVKTNSFKGGFFWMFSALYSTLLHLPPLRFHCVVGCYDRTQGRCDFGIGFRRSNYLARSHPQTLLLTLNVKLTLKNKTFPHIPLSFDY
jgi:hypothetical protein